MSRVRSDLDKKFYQFLVDNKVFFNSSDYQKILLFIKREKSDSYNRGWKVGSDKKVKL